jgi:hypothetical protein
MFSNKEDNTENKITTKTYKTNNKKSNTVKAKYDRRQTYRKERDEMSKNKKIIEDKLNPILQQLAIHLNAMPKKTISIPFKPDFERTTHKLTITLKRSR